MECITYGHCISHLVASLPPQFTLHHATSNTISNIVPSHTTYHVTPPSSVLAISHRVSYHTNTSRSTLFHFAIPCRFQIAPYRLALHPIFTFLTYHITPHSMYSMPHFRSHHILATSHLASHFTQDIAPHFTCSTSCIIPPHLTVITPIGNSTSHYHVSHNIPHHP